MEITKELLESKEYNFLRENPHLKDRILFLCVAGSHAYGTNTEDSDIDIRGVCLETTKEIYGFSNFEQYVDNNTDTVIYGLKKFVHLAMNCNPNIIEMLFCKPEHYLYVSELGQIILDNAKLFLSKKAFFAFGGYASAQIKKIDNAVAKYEKYHDDKLLNKAMMHSARLYRMGIEILKTGNLTVYNEKIIPLLRKIRSGDCRNQDGSIKNSFYELIEYYENVARSLQMKSKLPDTANTEKIEEIVIDIYKKAGV